jgi:hypothetical protein
MSVARFKVFGQLDNAGRALAGTVMLDRAAGLFSVRPARRRRVYTLPLADVATMVCRRVLAGEVAEKKRAKAKARKGTGR